MQVFINETSLNDQFADKYSFRAAVKNFIDCIEAISNLKQQMAAYNSDHFFYYTAIKGTIFASSLKADPSINEVFNQNMQRVNLKSWQKEQTHSTEDNYLYEEKSYEGTSVAELAERTHQNNGIKGFLLNFSNSQFGELPQINVIKNTDTTILIDCNYTEDSIEAWLINNGYLNPDEIYNEKSKKAPKDYQTVLKDTSKFEKTAYPKNHGRSVYRLIGTNQLWAVDSSPRHSIGKPHIEVFDEITKKHLGTSLYDQISLDVNFKKSDRTIDLG